MRQIDFYLARSIFSAILLVLLILAGLFTFFTFIDELGDVGSGRYTSLQALYYVLLQMPLRIYELFPLAVLLGCLLGLGGLANSSELTAIRAAGVSVGRILWACAKLVLVLTALVMAMGEWVTPWLEQQALTARTLAKSDETALATESGFWTRQGPVFVQVERIAPEGSLEGVYLYEYTEDHRLRAAAAARRAEYREDHWRLLDVRRTVFHEDRLTVEEDPYIDVPALLNPDALGSLSARPDRMPIQELIPFIAYLQKNDQRANEYQLALWSKVLYPVAVIVMILLTAPFVFGSLRSVAASHRVLAGSILGIVFHIANQTSSQVGLLYNFDPLLGAALPIGLFSLLTVGLWRYFGLIR